MSMAVVEEIGVLEGVFPIDVQFDIKKQMLGEIDEDDFFVEGFASTSDLDEQGDVITFNALKKAAKGLLKNSTALFNHDPDKPIGKIEEAEAIEGKGLKVKISISKTEPTIRRKIEEGIISKFSIRGRALKVERKMDESKNEMIFIIHEIDLVEVSLVSIAANRAARVTGFERVEAEKSFASAISKSIANHSIMEGGKEKMSKVVNKNEEGAPEGGQPVETPPVKTEGTPPVVDSTVAPVEDPAVTPAEVKPDESGKALSVIGDTLKALTAQIDILSGKKPAVVDAVKTITESAKTNESVTVQAITPEMFEARVAAEVAKALAKPKGETSQVETEAPVLKAADIPAGNRLVYLIAKTMGRQGEKLW